ncbi:MAG: recombination-associated protein RdgC [Desulfovibrio sp.]|nr:recombination-associated protein RdgC [Desulfovibrio sp.]
MSGFFSSATAMRIFKVSGKMEDFAENLEAAAFRSQPPDPGPDGKIVGFVGLADPLDTDFAFDLTHEQYMTLSLRMDERKPSAAAIRMRLAEAIKKESAANDGKISRSRKKELKESITAAVTAKADFVPSLVDIFWDTERGILLLTCTADAAISLTLELIQRVFGVEATPLFPSADMAALFQRIYSGESTYKVRLDDERWAEVMSDDYIVTLSTPEGSDEKATVSARGSQEPGLKALEKGMQIRRMGIVADIYEGQEAEPVMSCVFSLDDSLAVNGLKMPKHEKGNDREADVLLKASHACTVAELVEKLGADEQGVQD